MKITKFPYFFFFLQSGRNSKIEDNNIWIKDVKYTLKARNIFIYLLLKFLPIFIFFTAIFNQYDFSFTNEKIIQYILAISMFLMILFFKKIGFVISLTTVLFLGIMSINDYFSIESMLLPYIFKYLIFIYTIYEFYISFNYKLFEILENNKLKAHLII